MPEFEPDHTWERSVTWDNHYSYIRTYREEFKNGKGYKIKRIGMIAVTDFVIAVEAGKWVHYGDGITSQYTRLNAVTGSTLRNITFEKCYSEKYCVTLAKRFANKLREESQ